MAIEWFKSPRCGRHRCKGHDCILAENPALEARVPQRMVENNGSNNCCRLLLDRDSTPEHRTYHRSGTTVAYVEPLWWHVPITIASPSGIRLWFINLVTVDWSATRKNGVTTGHNEGHCLETSNGNTRRRLSCANYSLLTLCGFTKIHI